MNDNNFEQEEIVEENIVTGENKSHKKGKLKLTPKAKKMLIIGGSILLAIIIAIILSLTIFKGVKDNKEEEKENPKPITSENLKIIDPNSNSRPIAIMINNAPAARPYHRGLQDAYIVYEIVVEGGITRMMALYKDVEMDEDLIGSVRSSRHYYLDYVMENDAIYVHHGKSPQADSDMSKYGINHIDAESPAFTRDYSLPVSSEHTSFANLKGIQTLIDKKRFRKTLNEKGLLLNYKAKTVDLSTKDGAIKADKVNITYSSVNTSGYVYDSENKVYLRNVNGVAHTDYDTKSQYTVKNIITYQIENTTILNGGKGRQELHNTNTSGTGYYISNGYAVPIKWSKGNRDDKTVYTYLDGTEIEVNDGNTFIQIQPKGQDITIE